MTNAQKWIAAFLGLFIVLFILVKLTQQEEPPTPQTMEEMMQQSSKSTADIDGLVLFQQTGCTSCHGDNVQGSNIAPALVNIKQNWTRDELINYLRNPSAYSGGSRFNDYRAKYKNIIMPSYNNIDVKELGKIAEYLLTK